MDRQRPRYRILLALLWLPLAFAILIPAIILLGLSFYIRAVMAGLAALGRSLLRVKRPSPSAATQAPHLIEIATSVKKTNT